MLSKNSTKLMIAAILGCVLAETSILAGPSLQNGDFSSPLSVGWTDYDVVTIDIDAGVAVLGEDPDYWAFLEQEFTIPGLSLSLSFEYKPLFEADGQESFSASLLDPGSSSPLVPTANTYFLMHDWDDVSGVDDVLWDPLYTSLTDVGDGWTRVRLDLTSLGGVATNSLLAFDFIPGFDDGSLAGQIRLDNVSVQVIPAPSAVILGLIGLGSLRALRRRYKQLLS